MYARSTIERAKAPVSSSIDHFVLCIRAVNPVKKFVATNFHGVAPEKTTPQKQGISKSRVCLT